MGDHYPAFNESSGCLSRVVSPVVEELFELSLGDGRGAFDHGAVKGFGRVEVTYQIGLRVSLAEVGSNGGRHLGGVDLSALLCSIHGLGSRFVIDRDFDTNDGFVWVGGRVPCSSGPWSYLIIQFSVRPRSWRGWCRVGSRLVSAG